MYLYLSVFLFFPSFFFFFLFLFTLTASTRCHEVDRVQTRGQGHLIKDDPSIPLSSPSFTSQQGLSDKIRRGY